MTFFRLTAHPTLAAVARRWRQQPGPARWLLLAALLMLLAVAARSLFALVPQHYALTISGGDITSNRHFLAEALREAAAGSGVKLTVRPVGGSQQALALVAANRLDFAFIQGGLDLPSDNVVQVATVAPELLHFLARPGIDSIADLRGHRVNLGVRKGGTRLVAYQILAFAGLREGIDFVESNIATEELLTLHGSRLPDAVVITSFIPSDVVDYLVRKQGYRLLDLPFTDSFALRHAWAVAATIPAAMYSATPAVPARAIAAIGVELRLVANRQVARGAVYKLLESLYGGALAARLRMPLDESRIMAAGSYPPADGARAFVERNQPLFARAALDQFKAGIGLVVSLISTTLVIVKWLKSVPLAEAAVADSGPDLHDCLAQLAALDAMVDTMVDGTADASADAGGAPAAAAQAHGQADPPDPHQPSGQADQTGRRGQFDQLERLERRLSALKAAAIGAAGQRGTDGALPPLLLALADTRARLAQLRGSLTRDER